MRRMNTSMDPTFPLSADREHTGSMSDNPLKLRSIHHVEWWTGVAKQAAYFYGRAFAFSQIAYAGLETGQRDRASYAMAQGKARLVVTSPLDARGAIAEHIAKHGDSVRDIAF